MKKTVKRATSVSLLNLTPVIYVMRWNIKIMPIMENGKTAGQIHQEAKEWSGMLMKK